MEGYLFGLLSAATLALCGIIAKQVGALGKEFKELKVSQRNQIKTSIVQIYENASERGYITHLELETVNRNAESYKALGGNTYIETLVNRLNNNFPIHGEAVPEHNNEE